MKTTSSLLFCVLLLFAGCQTSHAPMDNSKIDVQGHRGCRGLMPENTIPGFIKALELGVTTLELDVCISKDMQVVVSHEPWLSAEICSLNGEEITEENQQSFNLFALTYAEIAEADCGSKKHPRFPNQALVSAAKPRLIDVILAVKKYCNERNINLPFFNIETKMRPDGDDTYHPKPEVFCDLVLDVIKQENIESLVTLQSFDFRALEYIHSINPAIVIAALVENALGVAKNLQKLSFTPTIYSPYFELISEADVEVLHQQGILVKPWTVNEKNDIEDVLRMNVDGIISDYPNRVFEVIDVVKNPS